MKILVLCDFDGTISTRDLGYDLLNRFTAGDWEAIDRKFREGKIGSREAYSQIASLFRTDKEEIVRFIRDHSSIDTAFPSFYAYCVAKGIDVRIVSDGFDFYIGSVLAIHHLADIPYHANGADFSGNRTTFSFPHADTECGLCGTCKKNVLQGYRKEYDSILYIGNGLSDRCAAREADFVFAKDSLYATCIDEDILCHFYQDFQDIHRDMEKEIRGVIFDLDGTLIDASEAIYLGMNEVWQAFGRTIFPFEDLGKHLQSDLETTLGAFFSPEQVTQGIPIMRKKYEEIYLDKTRFVDGARDVLGTLHGRGVILGVASNKFGRFTRGALTHLGVHGYFTSLIGAGDVPRNKPFPDMIHAALTEMNLPAEDVVFVGDTPSDIETGKHAGVDVYALPTGFHSKFELSEATPRRILRRLDELIDLTEGAEPSQQPPTVPAFLRPRVS
jgi:2-hydroxy-3-keto-5-methylthiopentenyl-1-phosphate phosphatase